MKKSYFLLMVCWLSISQGKLLCTHTWYFIGIYKILLHCCLKNIWLPGPKSTHAHNKLFLWVHIHGHDAKKIWKKIYTALALTTSLIIDIRGCIKPIKPNNGKRKDNVMISWTEVCIVQIKAVLFFSSDLNGSFLY